MEFKKDDGDDEKFTRNCIVYEHKESGAKVNLYENSLQITTSLENSVSGDAETSIGGILTRFHHFIDKHNGQPAILTERVESAHANINVPKIVSAVFNPADDAYLAFHNMQKAEQWLQYNQASTVLSTHGSAMVITGVGFNLPSDAKEQTTVFVFEADPVGSVTATLYSSSLLPGETLRVTNHINGFATVGPNRQIVASVSAQVDLGSLYAGFAFRTVENQDI